MGCRRAGTSASNQMPRRWDTLVWIFTCLALWFFFHCRRASQPEDSINAVAPFGISQWPPTLMPERLLKYSVCSNIICHNADTRPAAVVCPGERSSSSPGSCPPPNIVVIDHRQPDSNAPLSDQPALYGVPLAAIPGPTRPKSPRNLATPTTVAPLLIGRRPRNRPLLNASALSQAPPIRLIGRPVSRMWGNFLQSFPKLFGRVRGGTCVCGPGALLPGLHLDPSFR